MNIPHNLSKIHQNISQIKKKFHIQYPISLVAVSKKKSIPDIQKAIQAGQFIYGENRLQEALTKIPLIKNPKIQWHFIGKIQKNKAKKIAEWFHAIQSIDQIETAHMIHQVAQSLQKIIEIYIQVNTSNEPQKGGINPDKLPQFLKNIQPLPYIQIQGLMTMAQFTQNTELVRQSFQKLRKLQTSMQNHGFSLPNLSMGMSNDYELAIQEGATHIRIGQAIFGPRNYPTNTPQNQPISSTKPWN